MTEEPYRWVEAIQNRREYIEMQLAAGSPIAAISCAEGVLLLTVSRERQKLFEIYDRIAMGAIGHPGDIERLRMSAIEVTSAEGFNRSPHDVSLRRLAAYSLSPLLKNAFEQIYGAPYLARMLYAELGRKGEPDLLLRLDYDGSFHTNGGVGARIPELFAAISGKPHSARKMEEFLRENTLPQMPGVDAYSVALDAWVVGHLTLASDEAERPTPEQIKAFRHEQIPDGTVEAALLDRHARCNTTYRFFEP